MSEFSMFYEKFVCMHACILHVLSILLKRVVQWRMKQQQPHGFAYVIRNFFCRRQSASDNARKIKILEDTRLNLAITRSSHLPDKNQPLAHSIRALFTRLLLIIARLQLAKLAWGSFFSSHKINEIFIHF